MPVPARCASLAAVLLLLPCCPATPAFSADLTAAQVTQRLFRAAAGERVDFSGANLDSLDLAGLDFKGARMARTDVFGVDLTRSNLSNTDLSGARLDRTVISWTNLSGANMEGASLMRPTVFTDLRIDWREAPRFAGTILRGSRLTGRCDGASFRGADLSGTDWSPHEPRSDISFLPRNFCRGCDFTGASLRGANFDDASLVMAKFQGADLSGAKLSRTDLSSADLTGADLTGADLANADLTGAILTDVRGLDSARGLALARGGDLPLR